MPSLSCISMPYPHLAPRSMSMQGAGSCWWQAVYHKMVVMLLHGACCVP